MFKVGDKVYHIEYGWGIITKKDDKDIELKFGDTSVWTDADNNLLSFTEYTLEGFSQERPIELPQVGELCLVRDFEDCLWKARNFKIFTAYFVDDNGQSWDEYKRIKILD